MITNEQLAELEASRSAIEDEKWIVEDNKVVGKGNYGYQTVCTMNEYNLATPFSKKFMVSAFSYIPALIAEIRRLRQENEDLRYQVLQEGDEG